MPDSNASLNESGGLMDENDTEDTHKFLFRYPKALHLKVISMAKSAHRSTNSQLIYLVERAAKAVEKEEGEER